MTLPEEIQLIYENASCLYSRHQIETALDRMAHGIREKVAQSTPLFLCVVIGGMIPLSHLLLRLEFPLEIDYIHATRFQGKTKGGEIFWKAKPSINLKDRSVVIVDDILDSGITMQAVVDYCKEQGAKEIHVAVLVNKHLSIPRPGFDSPDFVGVDTPDQYIFGFGMDYKEYLRNVPGIYAVAEEE